MAKKNSIDLQVLTSVPGFTKLEGIIVEKTAAGVLFDYRKPGGQNRIQELVPRGIIIAVVGNVGKEGATLWKLDTQVIFGTKQRNTMIMSNPDAYGDSHYSGSNNEYDTIVVNTAFSKMQNETKSEEGGRGRKPGKAKVEKPAKPTKEKKGKADKKDDWT